MYRIGQKKSNVIGNPSFQRLVQGLKDRKKTIAVVESSCGGLIQASIMAVPGSSQVYFGGSIAYNTKRSLPLLFNDKALHERILHPPSPSPQSIDDAAPGSGSAADDYIRSKEHWTAEVAKACCDALGVDYAIAEGGASGPTFRPNGMETGFAVMALAGKRSPGTVASGDSGESAQLLAQHTIRSTHADREANMRLFAEQAATWASDTIGLPIIAPTTMPEEATEAPRHLDRATHLRTDPDALQTMQESEDARFVVLNNNSTECLFWSTNSHLALLSRSQLPPPHKNNNNVMDADTISFLGLDPDTKAPLLSINLNADYNSEEDQLQQRLPNGIKFGNTRTHAPLMPKYEYELVLYATALSNWKRTHKFCSICASPLVPIQGGTCLQCTSSACGQLSWPRQDPSIIVLVTNDDGDKALLARSPRHPPKVHTALAGFVEAGETFEQAVVREVMEETGTVVEYDSIQYVASQPWPFPRSCMIGFIAQAATVKGSGGVGVGGSDHDDKDLLPLLTIDETELVSAGWFSKDQVRAATQIPGAVMNPEIAMAALAENPSLDLLIPPTGVLARSLIDHWLDDEGPRPHRP